CCPSSLPLSRRRPHRAGQSGPRLPVPSPAAPPRCDHPHRPPRPAQRHRQRRPHPSPRIAGPPPNPNPTGGPTVSRTHRRTRPLVVVPTLPTPTTTHPELGSVTA